MRLPCYFASVILLPLIPAVLLYLLFDTSSSAFFSSKSIQLGGPVAAYFILLLASHKIFNTLLSKEQQQEIDEIVQNYRDNEALSTALQGQWLFKAQFRTEPGAPSRTVQGSTDISKSKYRLRMDGNWLGEQGNSAGRWAAKQVFLDDQELVFLFQLPDPQNPGSTANGLGRVAIHRDSNDIPQELIGSWSVLGRPAIGEVTFTRSPD